MEDSREFSIPRWLIAANFAVAIGCFALAAFAFRDAQIGAAIGGLVVGIAIASSALVLLTTRVVLTDQALIVSTMVQRNEYARSDVLGVKWTSGAPVSIDVAGMGWIKLPYLGPESHPIHVVLNRWITSSRSPGAEA